MTARVASACENPRPPWSETTTTTVDAASDDFAAIASRSRPISRSVAASTVVVVVSDHGGLGFSHADATRAVNYTIPFFVWGRGVPAGADLYRLNPDRADPGTSRPTYAAAVQPIRNAEAGNLVTELLGLRAIPGSRINAAQTLDVA